MKELYLEYNLSLKQKSRDLRNNSTLSEVLLWKKLKAGKMMGYKFNRQKPLLNYIVDFYCKRLNLVIEIDGTSHRNQFEKDLRRQNSIENLNLNFLRFDDSMIKKDMSNVIRNIEIYVEEFEQKNPPNPLIKGELKETILHFKTIRK